MQDFNHQNALYDLKFAMRERGRLRNGEPMTPFIEVEFEQAFGARLTFLCLRIEALERLPLKTTPEPGN